MPSTTLSVCPHLPPTTNILNSQQRTRLMRSTRKLGAVLGTTPYLCENDTSFTLLPLGKTTSRALKRQGSIFAHSQASSLSISSSSTSSSQLPSPPTSPVNLPQGIAPGTQSIESRTINPSDPSSTLKRRLRGKPPQLYLQLNTVPVSPTDDRFASSVAISPSASAFPTTPTTPVPDIATIRRKRMVKLAHYLGENIPVELIFTSEPTPKPATVSSDRHPSGRSRSVHVLSDDDVLIYGNKNPLGQSHSKQEWVGEWNRSNINVVQKELRNLKL